MKIRLIWLTITVILSFFGTSPAAAGESQSSHTEIFEEIVTIVEENFYNPEQIRQDFPAIKAEYRTQLADISDRKAFSSLVNGMLQKLNASHTYYLTPEDKEYYQLGDLFSRIPAIGAMFHDQDVLYPTVGILTQTIEEQVYITAVLAGGVAEKAGALKGDEIVSVNGKPYEPIASIRSFVGKDVAFEIRRNERNEPFTITMQPELVSPKAELLAAQEASVRVVEQAGVKIGYVHLYSYGGYEYHEALVNALTWGTLKDTDALVIDLRYGLGGAGPSYLNLFNTNIPVLKMYGRDGTETVFDPQWRKPAAYLVNGFSRSGKELLAFGARKYDLATVIGERTPGHFLGGRLFPLSNGDALYLAVQYCLADGVNLEGLGVAPDIEVPFDVRYCAGHDTQLKRSFEYLADQVVKQRNNTG